MAKRTTLDELRQSAERVNVTLKSSVATLGVDPLDSDVKLRIPTGWTLLDETIGGGLPVGRTVELYGRESSGKTTLSMQAMASCQKMGGIVVLFDPESTFNRELAIRMGVNLNKMLVISSKMYLEGIFTCFVQMIKQINEDHPDVPILIVWDTLAATPTKKESEEQDDGGRMAGQYRAQVVRRGMRAITTVIAESNACLMVLNHVYDTAVHGIVKTETPGGRGVKFHASIRIQLKHIGWIREKDEPNPIGFLVVARIDKNKFGSPRKEVKSRFYFDFGFSDLHSLYDYACDNDIIKKVGAWNVYNLGGEDIKFYATKLMDVARDKPNFEPELRKSVLERLSL